MNKVSTDDRGGNPLVRLLMVCAGAAVAVSLYYLYFRPNTNETNGPGGRDSSRFREAAEDAGIGFRMNFLPNEQGENFKINLYDHGCGVAIADYDGDGHDDVYLLNQLGANALYRNLGNGRFEDVTGKVGPIALDDRISVGATFADYDNDGDQDLYVTSTRGGNSLFRNESGEKFVEVTDEAGVSCVAHSQTAAFFDFDNDGFLDLFITNTAQWTTSFDEQSRYYPGVPNLLDMVARPVEYNLLFRNKQDGTFEDVTEKAGLKGRGWGGDVAIWDYDEDGHLDLLVTNMFGMSQLYRNVGDGTFADVTSTTLKKTSFGAIGSKVLDINNDGRLDLCIVDMHSDMWMKFDYLPETEDEAREKYNYFLGPRAEASDEQMAREKMAADVFKIEYDNVVFGNTLFLNKGDGEFEEISDQAYFETFWPWGVATGDFDNDGYVDVFLPSGMGHPYRYWRSYLLMNQGDNTFTDQAEQAGIDPPPRGRHQDLKLAGRPVARSARCAATADFDGDGRLEIVMSNFNDRADYFRNQFPQRNYVSFRLTGSKSNRDAIGARVRIRVGDQIMIRQVNPAGGYLSQSTKTLHFGLGEATEVIDAEIIWPSGEKQTLKAPEINKRHDIEEPA